MKSKIFETRNLVILSFLVTLQVVLERLGGINVLEMKIGFGFLPIVMAAVLYGPVGGAVVAGMGDLLGSLLFPTGAYMPCFTLTAVLVGLELGFFLHKKRSTVRVAIATVLHQLVLVWFLNTYWIVLFFTHKAYTAQLVMRLPQLLIMTVVEFLVTMALLPLFTRYEKKVVA